MVERDHGKVDARSSILLSGSKDLSPAPPNPYLLYLGHAKEKRYKDIYKGPIQLVARLGFRPPLGSR